MAKISLKLNMGSLKEAIKKPFLMMSSQNSREPWLVRFLILILMLSVGSVCGTFYYLKKLSAAHHARNDKTIVKKDGTLEEYEEVDENSFDTGEENEEHGTRGEVVHGEESHDGSEHNPHAEASHDEHGGAPKEALELNPIPDEILTRQNGIPAAGYDLKEPEKSLLRELASAKASDIEVRVGNYFVDFDTIYSNTRVGQQSEGALVVKIALEASDNAGRIEMESRKEEFRGLINSLLFEHQKAALLTYEGKMVLKKEIQREINHKLKNGKVVDVLLSEFHMRP